MTTDASRLAAAIEGKAPEPSTYVQQPADGEEQGKPTTPSSESVPPSTPPAPPSGTQDDDEKPATPPPPSQAPATPPDGTPPPTDPLSGVKLDDLQRHPTLGPALQSWRDRYVSEHDRTTQSTMRAQLEDEIRDRLLNEHFSSLSEEELGDLLAKDKQAASDYGRLQQAAEQARGLPEAEAVSAAAQVYALSTQIRTYNSLIEQAQFPPEIAATLKGDNFKQFGDDAIVEWGKAIHRALIDQEVGKRVVKKFDEEFEPIKQERLAQLEEAYPGVSRQNGHNATPLLDLEATDSAVLFEDAFKKKAARSK